MKKKNLSYKKAGVNIRGADEFIRAIRPLAARTFNNPLCDIGGFGALFKMPQNKYREPVLVSSADGVGTKILVAKLASKYSTIGIDLVAMNVNDILCAGGKPLFFLDYIACGKLNKRILVEIVRGIAQGCFQAGCALIGGETAEMPGVYQEGDYDLAGFAVGIVERSRLINGSRIKEGDLVVGLESNGLHSNGFSLVRKVFNEKEIKKRSYELLKPTRIYTKSLSALLATKDPKVYSKIKGIAHVTGGAFYDKIGRIIPRGLCCAIQENSWFVPEIFSEIQERGRISDEEMFRTFNMGIGMVLVLERAHAGEFRKKIHPFGCKTWVIGEIRRSSSGENVKIIQSIK